jgi:hypothetical protein
MRIFCYLAMLRLGLAASPSLVDKVLPQNNSLALTMLDSIIVRQQGISVNASVKTSVIEAGLLLTGLREVLGHVWLNASTTAKYDEYSQHVRSGMIPALANVTADKTSPLDEFSVGTQFIKE